MTAAQPTVRHRIENLEKHLGVSLFTRAQNGLTLAPSGLELMQDARTIASAVAAFERSASGKAQAVEGTVRLSASRIMSVEVLPDLVAPLLLAFPALDIEVVATDSLEDIVRRDSDIAVRFSDPRQQALLRKQVKAIEVGLFATPGHIQIHGTPQSYDALQAQSLFIGPDRDDLIWRALLGMGLARPKRVIYRCDDQVAQLAALRAGLGIGVCQSAIAQRYGLIRILPELSLRMKCWVVMHEDLKTVARMKTVFDHLCSALG
jgi:DNA-binding transcriptional LysR family regulator